MRAQADKQDYTREMRKTLENTENLTIRQAEVAKLLVEDGVIKGVETVSGATYYAKSVVLATGVYLKAKCIYWRCLPVYRPLTDLWLLII